MGGQTESQVDSQVAKIRKFHVYPGMKLGFQTGGNFVIIDGHMYYSFSLLLK